MYEDIDHGLHRDGLERFSSDNLKWVYIEKKKKKEFHNLHNNPQDKQ